MPERFMRGIEAVNGIVWGPMGLGLLFGTGLLLTVRTGGFQLRRWGYWMRHTLGAILTDRSVTAHTAREEQAVSQFQSLCTALASTIGTGNLVGVATAILSGGAGAVFWMWVMALLGMMTSYAENVLGIYYRRKDPAGGWRGGPMYYLRDGLGGKPGRVLAVLECTAQSDALLPLYIRQGLALRALRPLNSLAPCFVLAAGCAARDPVPVWVPLQDRARLARLLASGYAALDSRQTAGQETLLAMYPA